MTRYGPRRGSACDLGRIRWYVAALALVVLVAGGGFAAYALGGFDRWLDDDDNASALDVEPPAELEFPPARTSQPVLAAATPRGLDRQAVEQAVRGVLEDRTFGKHTGVAVAPLESGRPVMIGSGTYVPASTLKNFTSLAALASLGRDAQFTTEVVRTGGTGKKAQLTLVGGGDPLLAAKAPDDSDDYPRPATLTDLAAQTANALKQDDVKRVTLSFDDSLFKGPDVSPHWEDAYVATDVTTPVSALWVDEGVTDDDTGERTTEPAEHAADTFAGLLAKHGIEINGDVSRAKAPDSADDIASVSSPPLGQIVQHTLAESDNSAADVMLRQLAIGEGEPASFEGGANAMRSVLTSLGVPWQGVEVHDGSGLSRDNRVTLRAEIAVLREAATSHNPDLRPVASGLPVAGFSGSLADRFTAPSSYAALGVARAKTGTLSGIHAYAGLTVDKRGTPLAFVAIANKVKDKFVLEARAGLDDIAAALTSCQCTR